MKKVVEGGGMGQGGRGREKERDLYTSFGNPDMLDGKRCLDGSGCKMQPASFFSAHSHMYNIFNLQHCFSIASYLSPQP